MMKRATPNFNTVLVLVTAVSIAAALALSGCSTSEKTAGTTEVPFSSAAEMAEFSKQVAALPSLELDTQKEITKISFGSCSDPKRPQPIWTTISQQKPNLHLNLGDNVYASRPEDRPLMRMYAMQAAIPEYVAFRTVTPMISTWDDHDYGQNDGGAENPIKDEAKAAFKAFYPVDAAMLSPTQGGVYHSVTMGPKGKRVQFLMLDTRSFRSPIERHTAPKHALDIFQPTQDTSKTLLGDEQWKWLENELKKPADLRILVSSIQLVAEEHGFEKWANFPHERGKLFELLAKNKIKNLLVISGDRHQGEISQMKTPQGTLITDITGSGINRTSTLGEEPNRHRLGNKYNPENFGLAEIDWKKKQVNLRLLNLEGKTVEKHLVTFRVTAR